jgi:hypothetical protein
MPDDALKSVKRWIAIAALLLFLGQMLLFQRITEDRKRNCESVRDAFRIEHEELGRAAGNPDDPRIAELDERVEARLEDCQ